MNPKKEKEDVVIEWILRIGFYFTLGFFLLLLVMMIPASGTVNNMSEVCDVLHLSERFKTFPAEAPIKWRQTFRLQEHYEISSAECSQKRYWEWRFGSQVDHIHFFTSVYKGDTELYDAFKIDKKSYDVRIGPFGKGLLIQVR